MSSLYGVAGSSAVSPLVSKKKVQAAETESQAPSLLENSSASNSPSSSLSDSQLREQIIPLLIQTIQLLLTKFLGQGQSSPTTPNPSVPTTALNEVSGAQGAFATSMVGAFGANAELNIRNLAQTNPILAANSSVRFSPEGAPKVFDAFGFALEDVQRLDRNSDSAIDLTELSGSIGNPFVAQQYLNVLDRNKDNKIDVVEAAALLLAQDGANSLFAGIVNPFQDPGPSAQANGQVTPQEFTLANQAITNFPSLATETLDQLQSTLDLQQKFEQFKSAIPELGLPTGTSSQTPGFDFSQLPDISQPFFLPKTFPKKVLEQFKNLFALINGSLAKR